MGVAPRAWRGYTGKSQDKNNSQRTGGFSLAPGLGGVSIKASGIHSSRDFAREAQAEDAGQASARKHLGAGLGRIVATLFEREGEAAAFEPVPQAAAVDP